ncbi:hypothetical protein [Pedobacter helvus]|uniref:Uncharacterized protein n=1 Tax=Pedobacter helvus TaxID=2563444 RepID=A0ABW9JMK7_9SPHI|nr:hypothetical protein [Pedobacter ureilyticus]
MRIKEKRGKKLSGSSQFEISSSPPKRQPNKKLKRKNRRKMGQMSQNAALLNQNWSTSVTKLSFCDAKF